MGKLDSRYDGAIAFPASSAGFDKLLVKSFKAGHVDIVVVYNKKALWAGVATHGIQLLYN